jgi:hypothetical protein
MYTTLFDDVETSKLLIDAGADPFITDVYGHTALTIFTHPFVPPPRRRGGGSLFQPTYVSQLSAGMKRLLTDAETQYKQRFSDARDTLGEKFIISKRLRNTMVERRVPDYIIRQSEYDNLCVILQKNTKPAVQALARSLNITISNKSKAQLCQEISERLNTKQIK